MLSSLLGVDPTFKVIFTPLDTYCFMHPSRGYETPRTPLC